MKLKLAKLILEAARIREESYDNKAANKARQHSKFIDFSAFYNLSEDRDIAPIIYFLLVNCWNNAIGWANKMLEKNHET